MQNISLNKKLVISANKTAEIQEKRFFIKMLEKKRKCLLKLLIHETDVPYGRGNCNVSTNKHMEENHLWYISNSDGADFVRLGDDLHRSRSVGESQRFSSWVWNSAVRRCYTDGTDQWRCRQFLHDYQAAADIDDCQYQTWFSNRLRQGAGSGDHTAVFVLGWKKCTGSSELVWQDSQSAKRKRRIYRHRGKAE